MTPMRQLAIGRVTRNAPGDSRGGECSTRLLPRVDHFSFISVSSLHITKGNKLAVAVGEYCNGISLCLRQEPVSSRCRFVCGRRFFERRFGRFCLYVRLRLGCGYFGTGPARCSTTWHRVRPLHRKEQTYRPLPYFAPVSVFVVGDFHTYIPYPQRKWSFVFSSVHPHPW